MFRSMLKRTFSFMSKDKSEYEKWTKDQLISRIRELEGQIEPATPEIASASPSVSPSVSTVGSVTPEPTEEPKQQKKKTKEFDFSRYGSRQIAIKFAYLGWNYSGLAYQFEPTPKPTIEQELLHAFHMAKLIPSPDPAMCKFSRCGRTDKGVSAMNQVIALQVRSNLTAEEQLDGSKDNKEIPYLSILNSLLPTDIRVTAVCLRPPPDFDARFSCDYRHYRYLFRKEDLDLDLMREGAKKYEGLHDFRNFCKIDGSKQITNYMRRVRSADIQHLKDDIYYFDLKGSAFLWHQVRCMMALLFLVGQKLENPAFITDLLDIEKYPSKPHYEMANDIPLILWDCSYENVEWKEPMDISSSAKLLRSFTYFKGLATDYQIKSTVVSIMEDIFLKDIDKLSSMPGCGAINVGNGSGRNYTKYVKLADREMGDTFEVVNAKHKAKKQKRNIERARQSADPSEVESQ